MDGGWGDSVDSRMWFREDFAKLSVCVTNTSYFLYTLSNKFTMHNFSRCLEVVTKDFLSKESIDLCFFLLFFQFLPDLYADLGHFLSLNIWSDEHSLPWNVIQFLWFILFFLLQWTLSRMYYLSKFLLLLSTFKGPAGVWGFCEEVFIVLLVSPLNQRFEPPIEFTWNLWITL